MKNQLVRNGKLKKGFTLIEYMIVVALVAIVGAITYGNYVRGENKANKDGLVDAIVNFYAVAKTSKQTWKNYSGMSNTKVWYSNDMISDNFKSSTAGQFNTPYADNGLDFGYADQATDLAGNTITSSKGFATVTIKGIDSSNCSDLVDSFIDKVMMVSVRGSRVASEDERDSLCASISSKTYITLTNN
ncbi:type IV pilin protein [Vibrio sp. Hal054]|uniref:type IV pilin protein n=1 Tax=Vibrio sp. Hal054 TaxID=3035158 RepID=UPI00301DEB49